MAEKQRSLKATGVSRNIGSQLAILMQENLGPTVQKLDAMAAQLSAIDARLTLVEQNSAGLEQAGRDAKDAHSPSGDAPDDHVRPSPVVARPAATKPSNLLERRISQLEKLVMEPLLEGPRVTATGDQRAEEGVPPPLSPIRSVSIVPRPDDDGDATAAKDRFKLHPWDRPTSTVSSSNLSPTDDLPSFYAAGAKLTSLGRIVESLQQQVAALTAEKTDGAPGADAFTNMLERRIAQLESNSKAASAIAAVKPELSAENPSQSPSVQGMPEPKGGGVKTFTLHDTLSPSARTLANATHIDRTSGLLMLSPSTPLSLRYRGDGDRAVAEQLGSPTVSVSAALSSNRFHQPLHWRETLVMRLESLERKTSIHDDRFQELTAELTSKVDQRMEQVNSVLKQIDKRGMELPALTTRTAELQESVRSLMARSQDERQRADERISKHLESFHHREMQWQDSVAAETNALRTETQKLLIETQEARGTAAHDRDTLRREIATAVEDQARVDAAALARAIQQSREEQDRGANALQRQMMQLRSTITEDLLKSTEETIRETVGWITKRQDEDAQSLAEMVRELQKAMMQNQSQDALDREAAATAAKTAHQLAVANGQTLASLAEKLTDEADTSVVSRLRKEMDAGTDALERQFETRLADVLEKAQQQASDNADELKQGMEVQVAKVASMESKLEDLEHQALPTLQRAVESSAMRLSNAVSELSSKQQEHEASIASTEKLAGLHETVKQLDETVGEILEAVARLEAAEIEAGLDPDDIMRGLAVARESNARTKFAELDKDGSGVLDVEELHALFVQLGHNLTKSQTQGMLDKIDSNKDGFIGEDEFIQLLNGTHPQAKLALASVDMEGAGQLRARATTGRDRTATQNLADVLQELNPA